MKKSIVFILLVSIILIQEGCFSAQKPVTSSVQAKVGNYDYSPSLQSEKNNIAIALIAPSFAEKMKYSDIKIFEDFNKHMNADFEELITAKGYNLRGPFENVASMVYNDKAACFPYLSSVIDLDIDFSNVKAVGKGHLASLTPISYYYTYSFVGDIIISGKINLVFGEMFTKEKVQAPSIPLPQKRITVASSFNNYTTTDISMVLKYGHGNSQSGYDPDAGLVNPIIETLEDYYKVWFSTSEGQLDPRQVALYRKDAEKAREGSEYIKH